jgi:hypothetical protein
VLPGLTGLQAARSSNCSTTMFRHGLQFQHIFAGE